MVLPLLPTENHPQIVLAVQLIIALTLSIIGRSRDYPLTVIPLFLTFALAIYTAYHPQVYLAPSLILICAVMLIKLYVDWDKEGYKSIIQSQTDIFPGCEDVTIKELIDLVGSEEKLQQFIYEIGVPLNVKLSDEYAPLISTYLINHMKVSKKCGYPSPSMIHGNKVNLTAEEIEQDTNNPANPRTVDEIDRLPNFPK